MYLKTKYPDLFHNSKLIILTEIINYYQLITRYWLNHICTVNYIKCLYYKLLDYIDFIMLYLHLKNNTLLVFLVRSIILSNIIFII